MARISKEVVPINSQVKEIDQRVNKLSSHVSKFKNQGNGLGKANAIRQSKAIRKEAEVLIGLLNQFELDIESEEFGN